MDARSGQQQAAAQHSLDGRWWWDGQAWRAVPLSPDEQWRWNGSQWEPNRPASPAGSDATAARDLAYHFSGDALWAIVFGAASVVAPLVTPIYFPILPVFGLWRGVLAVRGGRVAGGVIGLVVSTLGCLVSLLASGLVH